MTDLDTLEMLLAAAEAPPWHATEQGDIEREAEGVRRHVAWTTFGPEDAALVVALRNAAPELVRNVREARSLLAVIHRDGGHHTERVGFAQSAADAREIVYVMLAAVVGEDEP